MKQASAIAILLSTYNGEQYLAEQLDSLLAQTCTDYIVVARDDGSADGTLAILQAYTERHPDRFHLLNDVPEVNPGPGKNLGASAAFSFLMQYVLENKATLGLNSAYMMFCDQDDVWFPEKIERQMELMLRTEAMRGADSPILIHSDLRVVSADQELIAVSLARYQGLETKRNRFCNIVISNLVTGCTALCNEATVSKALPVAERAIMHDWWLAMVASAFGELVFIEAPLVDYRQHGHNTIGAKEHQQAVAGKISYWRRVFSLKPNEHLHEVALQAADFYRRYGPELTSHEADGLKLASKMDQRIGFIQRVYYRRARQF